jgi:hypothetical protein
MIHQVCPERVVLVLEAGTLELELALALLKFSFNFLDSFLGELGEVSLDIPPAALLEFGVIVATVTLEMVTEHVGTFHDPGPTLFKSLMTDKCRERLPFLSLFVKRSEARRSAWQGFHLVTQSSTRMWDAGLITTEMVTLTGV